MTHTHELIRKWIALESIHDLKIIVLAICSCLCADIQFNGARSQVEGDPIP